MLSGGRVRGLVMKGLPPCAAVVVGETTTTARAATATVARCSGPLAGSITVVLGRYPNKGSGSVRWLATSRAISAAISASTTCTSTTSTMPVALLLPPPLHPQEQDQAREERERERKGEPSAPTGRSPPKKGRRNKAVLATGPTTAVQEAVAGGVTTANGPIHPEGKEEGPLASSPLRSPARSLEEQEGQQNQRSGEQNTLTTLPAWLSHSEDGGSLLKRNKAKGGRRSANSGEGPPAKGAQSSGDLPSRVLSLDIGMKNFSWCWFDGGRASILDWNSVNLMELAPQARPQVGLIERVVSAVHTWIDSHWDMVGDPQTRVVVERQMTASMNIIVTALYSKLYPRASLMSPKSTRSFLDLKSGTYRARKKANVDLCRTLLASLKVEPQWMAHFDSYVKKDDLADSFLQAYCASRMEEKIRAAESGKPGKPHIPKIAEKATTTTITTPPTSRTATTTARKKTVATKKKAPAKTKKIVVTP